MLTIFIFLSSRTRKKAPCRFSCYSAPWRRQIPSLQTLFHGISRARNVASEALCFVFLAHGRALEASGSALPPLVLPVSAQERPWRRGRPRPRRHLLQPDGSMPVWPCPAELLLEQREAHGIPGHTGLRAPRSVVGCPGCLLFPRGDVPGAARAEASRAVVALAASGRLPRRVQPAAACQSP